MRKDSSVSINDIETEQSYFHSCKESLTDKCSPTKKCPCYLWVNCSKYINIQQQQLRLKLKNPKRISEIAEWYLTHFRFEGNFHDLYCSG